MFDRELLDLGYLFEDGITDSTDLLAGFPAGDHRFEVWLSPKLSHSSGVIQVVIFKWCHSNIVVQVVPLK